MNLADYIVLVGSLLAIAAYGIWQTRGRRTLSGYLRGDARAGWLTIGLSVLATQASAVTFLSTPGQGFASGLGFVQNYFGQPLALVVVALVFLPLFRKLPVYTAYEYLGHRFDRKTRLFAAAIFLLQRGLSAGLTVYAPAIVLSAVFGWRLDATILVSGLVVIAYTTVGGTDAVRLTQKYQMAVIFAGMAAAFVLACVRLHAHATASDAYAVAQGLGHAQALDWSPDLHKRYTVWSGLIGGFFLSLSYFGTDQSQVQRYLGTGSAPQARMGLFFNAVVKIPMQFLILGLGVLLFLFYEFSPAPVLFNETGWRTAIAQEAAAPGPHPLAAAEADYNAARATELQALTAWMAVRHATVTGFETGSAVAGVADPGKEQRPAQAPLLPRSPSLEPLLRNATVQAHARVEAARTAASAALRRAHPHDTSNDADYVFIRFIVDQLPHGIIGLLVAVFFAATLSSKAAELNALASTTTVDFYRHLFRPEASETEYVRATRWFTAGWGVLALLTALTLQLVENLIQAVNIVGSLFYGVVLGLFVVAFFLPRIRGTAVFCGGLAAEALVLWFWGETSVGYLWFNLVGCVACVGFSAVLQLFL